MEMWGEKRKTCWGICKGLQRKRLRKSSHRSWRKPEENMASWNPREENGSRGRKLSLWQMPLRGRELSLWQMPLMGEVRERGQHKGRACRLGIQTAWACAAGQEKWPPTRGCVTRCRTHRQQVTAPELSLNLWLIWSSTWSPWRLCEEYPGVPSLWGLPLGSSHLV